jgi:hypothetical protein
MCDRIQMYNIMKMVYFKISNVCRDWFVKHWYMEECVLKVEMLMKS